MRYIESQPTPAGTYTHNEVKQTVADGAIGLEYYGRLSCKWVPVSVNYDPVWNPNTKYRAQVEDDYEASSDTVKAYMKILQLVVDKFKSGNDIQVERITITRAEVEAISKRIL